MENIHSITPEQYSSADFEAAYTYSGSDLGALWAAGQTRFRVWAPTAESVMVNLYRSGTPGTDDLLESVPMTAAENGTWVAEKSGDLNGVYYTYLVQRDGISVEACDPYARTTGVNGQRAMVLDLASTNPSGWNRDADPHAGAPITDAVIYELHLRDLSLDENSGIVNKGKYLGLTERGTVNPEGIPTGLDHIKSLGITHLHLLPVYDYGSVDETRLDTPQFNWGYDPVNFNVPEGSYSTDPYSGAVRVAEFKLMVKALHDAGISVVMDVVYNHVYDAGSFCFNKIVPEYFSRSHNHVYSNGSGCGNDTASERSMVRKFIVDSVKYWADEYHIDGFRFDLVGLLDCETINDIVNTVHQTHPNVIFYGEGWSMATELTKENVPLCTQTNAHLTPGFAFFSDTIRDTLKGTVFVDDAPGFVSGLPGQEELLRNCFMARPGWCPNPTQTINYASCHDNMALFDRIVLSTPQARREDQIRMNNLAAAVYMTAQGVPFLQAGEEMLRSKPLPGGGFDENSYKSPDAINSIKWSDLSKEEYQKVFAYYQGLIAFRRAHPLLRLTTAEAVGASVHPVEGLDANVVAFRIAGEAEPGKEIFIAFNANPTAAVVQLPGGRWNVYADGEAAGDLPMGGAFGAIVLEPISAAILVKEEKQEAPADNRRKIALGALAAAAVGGILAALLGRKKK